MCKSLLFSILQKDSFGRKSGFMQTMVFDMPIMVENEFKSIINIYSIGRVHGDQYSQVQLPENGVLSLVKNIGEKFWPKIEILVKHQNFGQKSKFWLKI